MPSIEPSALSVTLKRPQTRQGAQDGSWIVFHGSPGEIQKAIGETFGLDVSSENLAETVLNAERVFRSQDSSKPQPIKKSAVETVVDALDGEVIREEKTADAEDIWPVSTEDDGSAGLGKGEEKKDPLLEQIEAAESRDALKMVYLANKAEWSRPEIAQAAKVKAAEWA